MDEVGDSHLGVVATWVGRGRDQADQSSRGHVPSPRNIAMELETDIDLDLDLDCLFEFDSPIETGEINADASRPMSPKEKASDSPRRLRDLESLPTSQLPRLSCRARERGLTAAGRASR